MKKSEMKEGSKVLATDETIGGTIGGTVGGTNPPSPADLAKGFEPHPAEEAAK